MGPPRTSGVAISVAVIVFAGIAWMLWGSVAGFAVLAAGHLGIALYHARNLHRLERWAEGPIDGLVPDSRGPWQRALGALHRRVRIRSAQQRDLADRIRRFQEATDAVPDGIVVLDELNRVRWLNLRAQAHLGLHRGKDTGRPIANLARQPALTRYLDREDFSDAVVIESAREPGVMLAIQVVPFGADERLLISRDVTRLQSVERMRRDFIANVSHELKTPLTVIAGFLETLQDLDLDDAARKRYTALMFDQARSMQRLVNDLLTLSTLESQGMELAAAPFPVQPLLRELEAEARALSAGAHEILVEAGPAAQVVGNRDELRSAFANLVSNAVRYTPFGGRVTLRWQVEPDGSAVFSVADTGIGIAAEHIPRLTERFYRVDRSRSRATGGTGLGLAIVKHVVLRHEAELAIRSEPGRGSTFGIHLPASRIVPGELADTASAGEHSPVTSI